LAKVGIAEAARTLGISQDTVRKRLRAGELGGERVKGPGGFRWVLDLDGLEPEAPSNHTSPELVKVLSEQVLDLRAQLDARTREISELHQLLAARSLNSGRDRPWWKLWG